MGITKILCIAHIWELRVRSIFAEMSYGLSIFSLMRRSGSIADFGRIAIPTKSEMDRSRISSISSRIVPILHCRLPFSQAGIRTFGLDLIASVNNGGTDVQPMIRFSCECLVVFGRVSDLAYP